MTRLVFLNLKLWAVLCIMVSLASSQVSGALITDSDPNASRESGDPFGLPGSGLARDYFGVAVINDLPDPSPDEFFIAGTETNFKNDFPVWPASPLPGEPSALMGRNLDHINPDGNGNQNYSGETATWSVTVPAGVFVTNIDFTSQTIIREGPTGSDYEVDDELIFVVTAPGSAIDGSSVTQSANDVDAPEGDGTYLFASSSMFNDSPASLFTAAPTEFKVVVTVNQFDATAEAFWTSGVLSVEYVVPEPATFGLASLAVVSLIARRRRSR